MKMTAGGCVAGACYYDSNQSMYVFGGCTQSSCNAAFNDLWRLDLNSKEWIRPLASGQAESRRSAPMGGVPSLTLSCVVVFRLVPVAQSRSHTGHVQGSAGAVRRLDAAQSVPAAPAREVLRRDPHLLALQELVRDADSPPKNTLKSFGYNSLPISVF